MLEKKNIRGSVEEFRSRRREEKKMLRQRKREWEKKQLEDIGLQLSKDRKDLHKLYRKINNTKNVYKSRISILIEEDGKIIIEKRKKIYRG
ncbi:hypothetical protein L9F63_013799, partial [Diploptera punctata]